MREAASARERLAAEAWLYLAVGLGSALGGSARWLLSQGLAGALSEGGLLWGTWLANVSGSLTIGFYAALAVPGGPLDGGPHRRHFVMTGFCGGYTTFSIFSLESVRLVQAAGGGAAALHVGISVATWLLAALVGHALGNRLRRARRR